MDLQKTARTSKTPVRTPKARSLAPSELALVRGGDGPSGTGKTLSAALLGKSLA